MLQNDDMVRAILDPDAMRGLMAAEGINVPAFDGVNPLLRGRPAPAAQAQAPPPANINVDWNGMMDNFFQSTGTAVESGGDVGAPPAPAPAAARGPAPVPAEERFANQLEQLAAMGFTDTTAAIRALEQTQGNVHAAVERLL